MIGKFRVKFLAYNGNSAEDNCLSCMTVLKQYFQISEMKAPQLFDMSLIDNSISCSNESNAKFDFSQQTQLKSQDPQPKDLYTHKEMAEVSVHWAHFRIQLIAYCL